MESPSFASTPPWGKALLAAALSLVMAAAAQPSSAGDPIRFGKSYEDLKPGQRRLIDDWVARFNRTMDRDQGPETVYDSAPVSVRSTFEAVTHALMTTPLTGTDGRPMGTALDLIARLDSVHGKIRRSRGDLQFRIYVTLKPGALEKLAASKEFARHADNTIYHKGYPINYRQRGGVPSIQISIARNGREADIDVDYRSSRFPSALINGHLTASNSDVRAGNNYDRHVGRWQGLANWWRSLFGLPAKDVPAVDIGEEQLQLAALPRERYARIEEAVADFLKVWLLEQDPLEAMGYFSPRSEDCVVLKRGGDADRGMVRYEILRSLMSANDAVGKPETLKDVLSGVHITQEGLRVVRQPHHAQFVIFEAPDDLAYDFDCGNRLRPEDAGKRPPRRYGKYYAAVFRVHAPDRVGETLLTLWTREKGYWRLVSFELEPGGSRLSFGKRPQEEPSAAAPPREAVAAPAGFLKANHDHLESWLVRRDVKKAIRYFSPAAAACYELLRSPEDPEAKNAREALDYTAAAMAKLVSYLAPAERLEDVIIGVEFYHPELRPVRNPHPDAYALAAVPDHLGEGLRCARRASGEEFSEDPAARPRYGRYYATSFRLRNIPGQPAVFRALWTTQEGKWRIVAYDVVTH